MTQEDRGELGCAAFGHFASPFVDGELPQEEMDRFAAHLSGCDPCRRLTADYDVLDRLLASPPSAVSEASWDTAWAGIAQALRHDREEAAVSSWAPVRRLARRLRLDPLPLPVRPIVYLAASLLLVVALLAIQRAVRGPDAAPVGVAALSDRVEVTSVKCKPDFVPVVYTTRDDDAVTVVQCAFIGTDT